MTPRFSWREWAMVLIGVGVITAMILVAQTARSAAERHLRGQALVERVRAESQQLSAVNYQGLSIYYANPTSRAGLDTLEQDAWGAWSGLVKSLGSLAALEPGAPERQLQTDADVFYGSGIQALTDLATGDFSRVVKWDNVTFRPALARFDADARRFAAAEQSTADAASERAGIAYVGSLVVGLLSLLLLGSRLHLIRRSAAIEAQERTLERRSEARTRALVEHASDVIAVIDRNLSVVWLSSSVRQMLGLELDAVVGHRLTEFVHPGDLVQAEHALDSSVGRPGTVTLGARFRHVDGSWRHVEAIAENRLADRAVEGIVLSMRDVTSRKELEDELRHQAFHDSLTGLANRALFENRLAHALARARRGESPVAVLFLDLDDFKTINDSLGHETGDQLLQAVAIRIDGVVRVADTAARLGGDEFAVLVEVMDDEENAETIARRILAALAEPVPVGERALRASASIGLATSDGATDVHELLRNADTAMYAAKESGKNNVQVYEEGMHSRVVDWLELTGELQQAIDRGEFELDYQPIVDLQTGHITGVEALVRWRHPTRGRLLPAHFITLAEETGMIVTLGEWILRTACAQAAAWHREFSGRPPLEINVNVSTRQLREPSFADLVARTLARTQLDPTTLVLEITESLLPGETDATAGQLERIKALGVRIAVDDFGTGYSALSRLQHFPIDIVKIDRSFITGMEYDADKAELVRGILTLGETLHLQIVAEGIEETEQADQLRAMRSPRGQGYLFSRPVAGARIAALLREDKPITPVRPSTVRDGPCPGA